MLKKNLKNNEGKHICRQCYLKDKNPMKKKENVEKLKIHLKKNMAECQ